MPLAIEERKVKQTPRGLMKANVFRAPGKFGLEEKPIPHAGHGEAVVQVRLTTICGTDIHIVKGEYPVTSGITIGHEAVRMIHELGAGVTGYEVGQRVLMGAITPCGQCEPCLGGHTSQCGGPLAVGNLGTRSMECKRSLSAYRSPRPTWPWCPTRCPMRTSFYSRTLRPQASPRLQAAASAWADTVAVFAQGPIGLCATLGARLMGASEIVAVDADRHRLEIANRFGASVVVEAEGDVVRKICELTNG